MGDLPQRHGEEVNREGEKEKEDLPQRHRGTEKRGREREGLREER